jgi:peptidoglycan hydrolase CwlO-like protein
MKTGLFLTVVMCVSVLSVSQAYGEDKPQTGTTPSAAPGPAFTAGKQQMMFQPVSMDPALVRQSMQARSEYDDLNRRIIARQTKLYEENARIKELQTQLRDLQQKIDKLLAQDEELNALKKKYAAITPEIPMGSRKGFPTNAMPFSTGR